MMLRSFLATALCALTVTSAHALTQAEISACYPDAVRLCGVTANDARASVIRRAIIGACMFTHRAQLSPRCDTVFRAHGY